MKKERTKTNNIYGWMMMLEGGLLFVPLVVLPFFPEDAVWLPWFVVPGGLSVLLGKLVGLHSRSMASILQEKKSCQVVLFAWAYGFFITMLPFLGLRKYRLTQILFESVSGLTTTGLSVLDVTSMAPIYLFYRSFLQFVGGLGFVMMMLVFFQDKDSMEMYIAEGHSDRLMPNIGRTAHVIFLMYSGFLALGVILYRLSGVSLFEGLLHAMCALSTGGFSNRLYSIGEYNSLPVELVTVLLMLVGTTNFAALLLLIKGKWRQLVKVSEIRFMLLLSVAFIPLMAIFLVMQNGYGGAEALRLSFFNAFSALSTTGFATCDYGAWGAAAIGIMVLLMLIGGGAGSTAGGIKLSRVYLVMRRLFSNIGGKFGPERRVKNIYFVKPVEGKVQIRGALMEEASTYMGAYLLIYMAGVLALTLAANCTLTEAMFEFASALGTVGLTIGVTSAESGNAVLWIEIIGMVLGRLEIFSVLLGIAHAGAMLRKRRAC